MHDRLRRNEQADLFQISCMSRESDFYNHPSVVIEPKTKVPVKRFLGDYYRKNEIVPNTASRSTFDPRSV